MNSKDVWALCLWFLSASLFFVVVAWLCWAARLIVGGKKVGLLSRGERAIRFLISAGTLMVVSAVTCSLLTLALWMENHEEVAYQASRLKIEETRAAGRSVVVGVYQSVKPLSYAPGSKRYYLLYDLRADLSAEVGLIMESGVVVSPTRANYHRSGNRLIFTPPADFGETRDFLFDVPELEVMTSGRLRTAESKLVLKLIR